ncbi:Lrp/AsnC family transcriptional regulator [Gammaproteobacteria bacterium]|jgi:Lrp/AsnC family transcriptional regulator|nr:Lrp/AsnC family transcriptional regulator [Gammaproteobacteria bacterium]MBT6482881.1 Lrp/AsnC family transcriptional regulator [Gammaproteobacteria bacterium]MBT7226451.1 Lrp/AsnC family transcriptional regulator [Gammaproteobacteria bacterium]MDB3898468.1 Lrp/AsnC family transcriptional regulator [Gammaproteobacteria bacterium]MDC3267478.1 Lrp/AsnC family transcriptional regulator [bacterium]
MDKIDRNILKLLQEDSTLSTADIAERVGLSTTPCWRRIQRLEESGVIRKRVALLARDKLNLGVNVFVAVKTNQHNWEWLAKFSEAVNQFPEVVEFYRMAGESDYLLRVVVPDIPSFDTFYKKLVQTTDLSDVSSSFAMEQIKYTTALPLEYAAD